MFAGLWGKIVSLVAPVLAVISLGFLVYNKGKQSEKEDQLKEELQDFKDTTERLDEVVRKNDGLSVDDARDELRDRLSDRRKT